ncbi:MBL fold metallo-hydrolase [Granulosicoccus sp. 3-233]|uniref:MBL fold metallo-hydrolase n=1 Tax=Granulosicoccus sp. 3-233 TaxID=3417969 RepID=UPI003D349371
MIQLSDVLWVQELDLGIFDVRGSLILGEERAVVWDSLSHPRDMQAYLPLIGDRAVTVVYSHADWDHVWGTAGLPRLPATVISHAICAHRFETDVPERLARMRAEEPGKWDDVQLVPPNLMIEQSCQLDLGNLVLELHHLPGHTDDCLIALLPEHGFALMGDTIETPFPVVPAGSDLPLWIEQLKRWERDVALTRVIPCHGPMGGRELISQTIEYLQRLLRGDPFELPASMTPFYQQTHEANLQWRNA